MTLRVTVRNDEQPGSPHNARVHRVVFTEGGTLAEDGVILKPGEEHTFTIYGTIRDQHQVRLAVEEEYTP